MTSLPTISRPGFKTNGKFSRKVLFLMMCPMTMALSTMRAIRVARAAPSTPRAGAPSLPKISTQFKNRLVTMDAPSIHVPILGRSMLRRAPT